MSASVVKDRFYMQMALDLATQGTGFTSPNPLVGAVVVKDHKVVGRGYHERFGGPHAEVNALNQAGEQARGATLYVTLEPCNHTGNTPPCTEKIVAAGIRRVVVAMTDPNPAVTGGGNAYLRNAGIEVVDGLAEDAARRQNAFFIKHIQTGRPFVILKCAATLDGRIATRTGDAHWVSGPESRQFVHELRHAVDAILVGVDTVKTDDPSLTTRLSDGEGCDPTRIILDTHLSIPLNARVLTQSSTAETIVVTGADIGRGGSTSSHRQRRKGSGIPLPGGPNRYAPLDGDTRVRGYRQCAHRGRQRVSGSACGRASSTKLFFLRAQTAGRE
jgi:diaminohydroxyphosphoribosylaminopyrimidine deaminase/5-amino-6-(5-phosphoribosylamino)uracil reductase